MTNKIKNEVCSLEYAVKLKKLNCKQDSIFYFCKFEDDTYKDVVGASKLKSEFILIEDDGTLKERYKEIYSAFMVGELGERLPEAIGTAPINLITIKNHGEGVYIYYTHANGSRIFLDKKCLIAQTANTEANARAKLYIYLLKNKIINPLTRGI